MRIGFGYDVHKLTKGRKLILGGVHIPFAKGLEGHSDADVLTHAVIDALIGAMGLGDIGKHFPPFDPKYKGISSINLLLSVKKLLHKNGYKVGNIDSTVVLEVPKLAPHIDAIRKSVAKALNISADQVNVKAKTEEGLGFTGEGRGISAYAVCLIHKNLDL
jgi:2-C-methyl-D-erythritol 2,4-cyclodiphosphate synthase